MPTKIQSILIDRNLKTLKEAYEWVASHGFIHNKIDVKDNYYRFRQFTPKPNKSYRTIKLTNGIKGIVEIV